MPLQNRVAPDGEIFAVAARGGMYGNRGGCFHRPDQTLLKRRHATKQWICCVLQFKGRRRRLMQPGLFTELFFLDEATALAAGHRPCFECRRADAVRFAEAWNQVAGHEGRAAAPAMDEVLHGQRIGHDGAKVCYTERIAALPNGVFVRRAHGSALVWDQCLRPWTFEGYGVAEAVSPETSAEVLTPRMIVRILAAGYRPGVHASAGIGSSDPARAK